MQRTIVRRCYTLGPTKIIKIRKYMENTRNIGDQLGLIIHSLEVKIRFKSGSRNKIGLNRREVGRDK